MEKYVDEYDFNYQEIKQIKEHAKQYDVSSDKKDFLKKVSPYEQKLILLNSDKPYEVLNYLDELNMENTRLILSKLSNDEIREILSLFSSEDKKKFYKYFSDLELVNKFIKYDENAKEHVENLNFDRKVEILDSSTKETEFASFKIYDSMSNEEQQKVDEKLTNVDSVLALDGALEDHVVEESFEEESIEIEQQEIHQEKEQKDQELENQMQELKEEKDHLEEKEQLENDILQQKTEFFKSRLEYYIDNVQEFKGIEIEKISEYFLLSPELRSIVDQDFNLIFNSQKDKSRLDQNDSTIMNNINNNTENIELFHTVAKEVEKQQLEKIIECVNEEVIENQSSKTM